MKKQKSEVLIPGYMKNFKCIGSECEDTCCSEWKVTIDKETYKKYRNCRHPELKKELESNVKRNRKDPTDANYSYIKMTNEFSCPFLMGNKLCKIQAQLGEEYLSHTCTTYPRSLSHVNGIAEMSASLSCPEVARLGLLNTEIMQFERIEEDVSFMGKWGTKVNTHDKAYENKAEKYFEELRTFTINVLQCRDYKLWERLVMLGIFYQTTQEYINQKTIDEIPELIVEYIEGIEKGIFDQTLSEVPSNAFVQVELLKNIINKRFETGLNSKRYADCFKEFVKGIKPNDDMQNEELIKNYLEAYDKYYLPFMDKNEYILENYLVNYVFRNLFPFSMGTDLFSNYVIMIVHYALVKMHLIGIAGYYKDDFNCDHIIRLIQAFAKAIEHNNSYIYTIKDFLEESGYTTLSHMLLLIKN